ncbi:MAG: RNA polymerase sigma factor [Bacteroidota bacterium]
MKIVKTPYNSMSDEDLMRSISNGERKAFDEIYARYSKPLLAYFMRMLWKDREKAEDFVHDLFAKIVQKPEYFDVTRAFKTWVYSVANNMCKNEYKKQEVRKGTQNNLDSQYHISDESSNVMGEVQDVFFREAFEKGMVKLDEKHREVFLLRHVQGLSTKEIAEALQINEGTVKSRVFYAIKYLSEELKMFNPVFNR